MANKHFPSLNQNNEADPFGRVFLDGFHGDVFDLTDLNVIHFGVDTVRQLYRGRLKEEVLSLFHEPGIVDFAGKRWHTGRVGRDSGYQYRLQNADLGLILLVKSFHAAADADGHHLKIEVSPHAIRAQTAYHLQQTLNDLADQVLVNAAPVQCAVHIAMDVQGWVPGRDFEAKLHCRSRKNQSYSGIDSLDFASTSAVYGRGETYTFGSASGIQLSVYDKTKEAKHRDKLDYWKTVWKGYRDDLPVTRIELRFHHSVVQQFADGSVNPDTGEVIDSHDYHALEPYLDGLWQYGLQGFRYLQRPGYFHPVWTVLGRHMLTNDQPPVEMKRYYKSASGFSGKNVELLLGNFISCAARQRMTARNTWRALRKLPFFQVLQDHYDSKGKDLQELRGHISELLEERYIRYGKAV